MPETQIEALAKLDLHNPNSNCVECCKQNVRLGLFLDQLEALLAKVTDPNALEDLPPVLKMASKFIH